MRHTAIGVLEARVSALEARIRAIESAGDLPVSWSLERYVSEFESDTLRMLEWLEGWASKQPPGSIDLTAREAWDKLQKKFEGEPTPQNLLKKLEKLAEYRRFWLQH